MNELFSPTNAGALWLGFDFQNPEKSLHYRFQEHFHCSIRVIFRELLDQQKCNL